MRTVLLFLYVGALHGTVSSDPPSPNNVFFTSLNLRNMLQWFPRNGTPEDTLYTVQYAIYGDSVEGSKGRRVNWREVPQCTDVEQRRCDLTNETWDLEHGYHARVRAVSGKASSKWASTQRRFDPHSDTTFGPPLVSVEIENNNAIISLTGPMRFQPNNHTPEISMATLYPMMMYNLAILNVRHYQASNIPVVSSPYKFKLMEYDTEYCFSASARFLSRPIQCMSSEWHCITTPPDPSAGQLQKVVVAIVVPCVCVCMLFVAGYILYRYLTGDGQKSPYILNQPSFYPSPLTFTPEKSHHVILITFIKDQPFDNKWGISDPECPRPQRDNVDPPPTYSPQRSETPSEPEEPCDDSSVDYGFVGEAPQVNVRDEQGGREGGHGGGEDWNNLQGEQPKCLATGCYKKQECPVGVGPSAGIYAAKSYLSQESTYACPQTHMPVHTQTEMSTLVQAQVWSQANAGLLAQTRAPLMSLEEAMDREFTGQGTARTGGQIDGGVQEVGPSERVPLLSAYASQNTGDIGHGPIAHADQSDLLLDDYGVVRPGAADEIEDGDEEGEEEGAIYIHWDPTTRQLVLPELGMDGLWQGENEKGNAAGGEEKEDLNAMKSELRLENVLVKQSSEEKAEEQREMERGGEAGCEVDDFLTKWNLVITMDE